MPKRKGPTVRGNWVFAWPRGTTRSNAEVVFTIDDVPKVGNTRRVKTCRRAVELTLPLGTDSAFMQIDDLPLWSVQRIHLIAWNGAIICTATNQGTCVVYERYHEHQSSLLT